MNNRETEGSTIIGWYYRKDIQTEEVGGSMRPVTGNGWRDLKVTDPDTWEHLNDLGRRILAPWFPEKAQQSMHPQTEANQPSLDELKEMATVS